VEVGGGGRGGKRGEGRRRRKGAEWWSGKGRGEFFVLFMAAIICAEYNTRLQARWEEFVTR
jgi:hypothetical protein